MIGAVISDATPAAALVVGVLWGGRRWAVGLRLPIFWPAFPDRRSRVRFLATVAAVMFALGFGLTYAACKAGLLPGGAP